MVDTIPKPYFADIAPGRPFEPDPDAWPPETLVAWAQRVEQGISEDPFRYQRAMAALGETATAAKAEGLLALDLSDGDLGAALRICGYLSLQADRGVEYDHTTEDALTRNSDYRQAVQAHKDAKPQRISNGPMSHFDRPNPNSSPARDTARRLRLSFYISRAAAWQMQQQPQQQAS